MRTLSTHDLIMATRVVKYLKITDEIKNLAAEIGKTKTMKQTQQIGLELFCAVIGNLGSEESERSLYEFLSGPFECDPDEIKNQDALKTAEQLGELIKLVDVEAWKSFFKSLASMTK